MTTNPVTPAAFTVPQELQHPAAPVHPTQPVQATVPAQTAAFAVPAKTTSPGFRFTIGDRELTVPYLRKLPAATVALLMSDDSGVAAFIGLFDGEDQALVGQLDMDQIEVLTEAWRAASGVTEGESSASGS